MQDIAIKELETCVASIAIGLSLGLIGAGGSILTIPIFVYVLKKDPISSSVYSMFVVGVSSLAGSIQSMINRLIDFKAAIIFGIPSVIGVFIARKIIFPLIPAELFSIGSFIMSKNIFFMLCLSSLMFLAAWRMLKPVMNQKQAIEKDKPAMLLIIFRGLAVGIITGVLGIGGGFLIVPALYFLVNLPVKKAIGTALIIITANSLFGFLNSYTSMDVDWLLLTKFSLGATVGILVGTKLSQKISANLLKKIFGLCILSMSFYIVYNSCFL